MSRKCHYVDEFCAIKLPYHSWTRNHTCHTCWSRLLYKGWFFFKIPLSMQVQNSFISSGTLRNFRAVHIGVWRNLLTPKSQHYPIVAPSVVKYFPEEYFTAMWNSTSEPDTTRRIWFTLLPDFWNLLIALCGRKPFIIVGKCHLVLML